MWIRIRNSVHRYKNNSINSRSETARSVVGAGWWFESRRRNRTVPSSGASVQRRSQLAWEQPGTISRTAPDLRSLTPGLLFFATYGLGFFLNVLSVLILLLAHSQILLQHLLVYVRLEYTTRLTSTNMVPVPLFENELLYIPFGRLPLHRLNLVCCFVNVPLGSDPLPIWIYAVVPCIIFYSCACTLVERNGLQKLTCLRAVFRIRIRNPLLFDPGSLNWMEKNPDSGSGGG